MPVGLVLRRSVQWVISSVSFFGLIGSRQDTLSAYSASSWGASSFRCATLMPFNNRSIFIF